jgi:aryl-alcohol dehydrogenase-like predicted oxidoreductase
MLVRGDVKTVAQGALQFCLSHPAVSTVIPGMRQVRHVEENVAVSTGQTYTPAERAALAQHAWPRNFYAGIW